MIDKKLKESNISELFLKPVLQIPRSVLDRLGYINTYLFNAEEDDVYENCLYLLFKPSSKIVMDVFLSEEEDRDIIILDKYEYGDYVLIAYRFPPKFDKDFDTILKGKYSNVSREYKAMFTKNVLLSGKKIISLQWLVFNKDKSLKNYWEEELDMVFNLEQEYWQLYNIEKESFKTNELCKKS